MADRDEDGPPLVRGPVRLQKSVVAGRNCIAPRREKMILDGRVEVDDRVVTEMGTRVDPDTSVIRVDGVRGDSRRHPGSFGDQQAEGDAFDDVRRPRQAVRR